MKNQNFIVIVLFLLLITIVLFFLQVSNNKVFTYFEKNIENLDKLISMDQIMENNLKSSLKDLSIDAILISSENSFSKNIWDSYPKCKLSYIPSVSEVKLDIENKIQTNLAIFKDFINFLNSLLFFYPFKIVLKIDETKYSVLIDETSVLRGLFDNKIPIEIENITVEIISPFGIIKKNYKVFYELENIRVFYIYRKIYNWINSKGYENIISKYSRNLFVCFSGYTATNNYNYLCESQKEEVCTGEIVKQILEYNIEKVPVYVCTEEDKLRIEEQNNIILNSCPVGKREESLYCKYSRCTITYGTNNNNCININKRIEDSFIFAVSGGGVVPPPGPPSGEPRSPSCTYIDKLVCSKKVIAEEPTGQACDKRRLLKDIYSPFDLMVCSNFVKCPSKDEIFLVVNNIKKDLENALNLLFSPNDNIICKVNIDYFEYNCDVKDIKNIYENKCLCLTKGGTISTIKVLYNISCTDNENSYFVNNKLKKLNIRFALGIFGQSICDPSMVNVDINNLPSFCCKIENIGSSKSCCAGIDSNGNCIDCPQTDTVSNIQSIDSILCIS